MGYIISITDAQGNEIAEYEYDEWGKLILTRADNQSNESIANINPIRYRGYYYDTETGYYYLQSRYYDPSICRFINSDIPEIAGMAKDISTGSNLFAYCCNNPINNSDFDGYFSKEYHKSNTYSIAWSIINNKLKKSFKYSKFKEKSKLKKLANKMAQGAYDVDVKYPSTKKFYSKYNQSFHFNVNSTSPRKEDSRMTRYYELRKKALNYLAKAKNKYRNKTDCFNLMCEAFYYFGMSLHPRQDMISHSGKGGNLYYANTVSANGKLIAAFYYHLPGYDNPNWKYKNTNSTKAKVFCKTTTDLINAFINIVIQKRF